MTAVIPLRTDAPNPFEELAGSGYRRLIPIIPPDATISPRSSLYARQGTNQDGRGKTPGVRGRDGNWYGFDWVPYEAEPSDYRRWHDMGAGVGVKTGEGLYALDADTLDETSARIVRDAIRDRWPLSVRIGRYPKALYPIRLSADLPYARIAFGPLNERGKPTERLEVLGDRRQFVAHGVHPGTRQPYRWPSGVPAFDDLPIADPADVLDLLERLRHLLPNGTADAVTTEGSGDEVVDQRALAGEPDRVARAVSAIPNTSLHFANREDYLGVGYAIKAALPDDPDLAFEIFSDWCARWEDGENPDSTVAADWSRMKPPFRRGAQWLYRTAERTSGGRWTMADAFFDPLPVASDLPFDVEAAARAADAAATAASEAARYDGTGASSRPIAASPYTFPDPTQIPPRRWLYGQHYIRQFVSATVAPSGVGKSSLALVEALAMASGKPLLGQTIHGGPHRVWVWNGEDPIDELNRRVAAAMAFYGLSRGDVGDRLFIDSGRDVEIILAADTGAAGRGSGAGGSSGCRINAPVSAAICETLAANRIDAMIVDPFVSSHRVSENDNGAIDAVTKQWARIANACDVSVELVHHVRKLNGGETTVEDTRGASALLATSRSARAISRMTKSEAAKLGLGSMLGRLFRFSDAKNNLALPAGDSTTWMQLHSVMLGNGAAGADGADAAGGADGGGGDIGDTVGVVGAFDTLSRAALDDAGDHDKALGAIRKATEAGAAAAPEGTEATGWRMDARSADWIGYVIAGALGVDETSPEGRARIVRTVREMVATGALETDWQTDAKRRKRQIVRLADQSKADLGASFWD